MATNLPIDGDRLWADLMALGAITDPAKPYTRRAFSDLFDDGRAFLREKMEAAGIAVHVDAAGNMIGRIEGSDPKLGVIALGSHSDTVPAGGRFDGVAGVVAALEVARALKERGEPLRHPLEVIDFLAEEPSDFGLSCIGSRGLSGALTPAMMEMRDSSGAALADALKRVGGDPVAALDARRSDFAAFLEMHIEQGPVLEASRLDIGVVSSIVGIRRLEIVFQGEAAHAGTAPMHLRKDAGFAAARTQVNVREVASKLAESGKGYFVATVGIVEVQPGGSNVVPGRCRMVIDARAEDAALTEAFTAEIDVMSRVAAETAKVERAGFEILSDGVAALCDPGLMAAFRRAADSLDLKHIDMASGAGHDAAFMARICPSGMVFIPCVKGMSHHPDEWASKDEVARGAAVLMNTVIELDRTLD